MAEEDKQKKILRLAKEVLKLSRNTLIVNLRFMDIAISKLVPESLEGKYIAADGKKIYFDPTSVLKLYKEGKEYVTRAYLHMIMHCVFCHSFINQIQVEPDYWDLACDIAVENAINELQLSSLDVGRRDIQEDFINRYFSEVRMLSAEAIYKYFLDNEVEPEEFEQMQRVFRVDSHWPWYEPQQESDDNDQDSDSGDDENLGNESYISGSEQLEAEWKAISEQMKMDLETFQKQIGDRAGSLVQNLGEVTREPYDYSAFLRKFAVRGEAMKVNDDEFDYNFYTYGLDLYDNMPLIEPLEYKEVKRIRDFVIVIDTSGSTSGELVQRFVNKTYNILKQEESYFKKYNLRIIQCDTTIQEDVRITSDEELERYISTMTIKGHGGTDFRPAFEYVNQLIINKEFTNLKGMIYFTDGWGIFPDQMPDYQVAFVFIDDEYNNYSAPPWVIQLRLRQDEI